MSPARVDPPVVPPARVLRLVPQPARREPPALARPAAVAAPDPRPVAALRAAG